MAVDTIKEIRRAVDTGKVVFGFKQAEKNILKGKGQIVIVSSNCPERILDKIQHKSDIAGIPFFEFERTSLELGSICGKPFFVSTLLIIDKGKSKVLDIMGGAKQKTVRIKKQRKPVDKKTSKKAVKKKAKKTKKKQKIKQRIKQKITVKKTGKKQKTAVKKTGKTVLKKTKKTKKKLRPKNKKIKKRR